MRPGARPLSCPRCNPSAANRRSAERNRAAKRSSPVRDFVPVEVPVHLSGVAERAMLKALDCHWGGRVELAEAVHEAAVQTNPQDLRAALEHVAGCALSWAAGLEAVTDDDG